MSKTSHGTGDFPAAQPLGVAAADYQLMVEGVTDYAIFMLNPEGCVLTWNRGARLLKGYEAAEVIGKHFSMFYSQAMIDRGWPQYELEQAALNGRFEDEGWRLRKDGTRFWANVIITPLVTPTGQLRGYSKITRDLTQRRESEEVLRRSEELFRLLVGGVRDYAIFFLNLDGTVASWNAGAELTKGYKATEIIGRHFSTFYPEDQRKSGWPDRELELATEQGRFEDEGWRLRKDGSQFWANVIITALHDSQGKHVGFAKITRDLTEKKRITLLEDEGRRINTFLAMLGHELRNPLAPISNALSLMALKGGDVKTTLMARDIIERQMQHLSRLVDDLLDVGRITSGKIHVDRKTMNLGAAVQEACEAVEPLVERKSHTLTRNIDTDNCWALGDYLRLVQVFNNVLVNAVKYTPNGGSISVSVARDHLFHEVRIRDNGQGIPSSLVPYVFDLFVQGEQDVSRSGGGLGLGLSLVKHLVTLHGGRIHVHSDGPGQGSEFLICIPAVEPPGETAPPLKTQAAVDTQRHILVVDDNQDSANSMSLLLQGIGHQTSVAYDGATALEAIKNTRPDAVLLDIGLPILSGIEVATQVTMGMSNPPVLIALTGYGQERDREASKAAGFSAHLTKPVLITELTRLLAKLLTARPVPGKRR